MFDGHCVCAVTCGLGTGEVVSLVHEEQATIPNFAYHDTTVLLDPFQTHVTVVEESLSLDEKKLRHSYQILTHEAFISAWRMSFDKGMLFSCDQNAMDFCMQSAFDAGLSPNMVLDGNLVWSGLPAFFEVKEDFPIFIVGRGKNVVVAFFSQGELQEVDHFSWDEDVCDQASFVLTEVIPCLQSHGVLDDDRTVYLVGNCEPVMKDLIDLIHDKLRIKQASVLKVGRYVDLLLGCLSAWSRKNIVHDVHAYRSRRELPLFAWRDVGIALLLASLLHVMYIWYTVRSENVYLYSLREDLTQYDSVKSDYIGVLNHQAHSMRLGLESFFSSLTCSLPREVWLTGMVLQLDKQKLFIQGQTRTKINLHDYSDSLVHALKWSSEDMSVFFVDPLAMMNVMESKKQGLKEDQAVALDVFQMKNTPYIPTQRLDSLGFQITNLKDGDKLLF